MFDDDASGLFCHVKLHTQVAVEYACYAGQTLCMPFCSVLSANVSPHNWEIFAQSRCKKVEHLKHSPDLPTITQKHSAIIELMQLPNDNDTCTHLLVQATNDRINKDIFVNDERGPTQNAMLVDDNLLAETWEQLKLVLSCNIESLCMLLRELDLQLRRSTLSVDK